MKYTIEVRECLARMVEVEASSEEEAMDIVRGMYDEEEIVLDAEDFVDVEFMYENEI